ncbi:hypothetical protein [Mycolicibacterium elephantis]|uniref:Mammalian cell entry protein n=1 Tax=Mycolicibacterium elephantis DSM 44368 TaxID=1335622 RepID=A0A439DQR7_9MYCO|nr:hypothetical protein [Mycolicibacterium elephantis]MCV7219610.1 hypothetical protein [Mycolicibacterium elephantis]RWA18126.1 hypothetical protein MELE44368_23700 [Mycolicibacterium elephantis DSM 44368]
MTDAAETDERAEHIGPEDANAESGEAAEPTDDEGSAPTECPKTRHWSKRPGLWVAAALVAAVLGAGAFGFVKYQQVTDEVAQLRQNQADRDTVAQLAEDYAMKSLNYTFEDPDAFFDTVKDGVSPSLQDKYTNAGDLLKAVMLQAQVSSTGEVLAVDPVAQPDGSYQVVVSAHQTTRNLQNPTPQVSIILLRVTVHKAGDAWQVADIGPETGSKQPVAQQIPMLEPPAASGPTPGPTPAQPSPPR